VFAVAYAGLFSYNGFVTSSDDFDRAAAYLVQEHGEAASARATWLAEMYRAKGNMEGYQSWSRVASRVLDLLAENAAARAPVDLPPVIDDQSMTGKSITSRILDLLAEQAATQAPAQKQVASKTRRRKS